MCGPQLDGHVEPPPQVSQKLVISSAIRIGMYKSAVVDQTDFHA